MLKMKTDCYISFATYPKDLSQVEDEGGSPNSLTPKVRRQFSIKQEKSNNVLQGPIPAFCNAIGMWGIRLRKLTSDAGCQ